MRGWIAGFVVAMCMACGDEALDEKVGDTASVEASGTTGATATTGTTGTTTGTTGATGTTGTDSSSPLAETVPERLWHVGQGTAREEHVHEGLQTSDGGYIGIGQTGDGSGRNTDWLIIKVDGSGGLQWQRRIGTTGQMDVGIAIAQTADGGYLAGGGLDVSGQQQRALVRLDDNGDEVWRQTYAGSRSGAVRGIHLNADGSAVVTGYTGSRQDGFLFIADEANGFLMKVDAEGDVVWDKSIDVPQGTKVHARNGGGYRVLSTGWTFAGGEDIMAAMIIHTDASGDTVGKREYASEGINQAFDFDRTSDGGAILAGHTTGYGVANWDCWVSRVDEDGVLMWSTTIGQPRGYNARWIHDECYGVRQLPDGGFVVTGGSGDEYSYSEDGHPTGPSDEWKVYLFKLDANGGLVWEGVYGDGAGAGNNAGEFLSLTNDGGVMVFTDSDSAGTPEPNNFGFMKLGIE